MKSKKTKSASQFPNIYRIITERLSTKKLSKSRFGLIWQSKLKKPTVIVSAFLVFLFALVIAFEISILGLKIYKNAVSYKQINIQRQNIQAQINFWQSVSTKYDGYKDAYFRMALLDYELGNFQKANQENQKALFLDPNFTDAINLEAILTKNNY